MPRAYSMDLRERVWRAWQAGEGSQRALAEQFAVSLSFVRDLSRRFRQAGTLEAREWRAGRKRALGQEDAKKLLTLVVERPDDTLAEHRERLAAQGGRLVSVTALWRALDDLGFTRKKRRSATTSPRPSVSKACGLSSKRR